jgi:sterol desaturase/sphingolipid hydroxylase (fatty acid hydroxylase superfamily)
MNIPMNEPWIRPTAFAVSFLVMFVLESLLPRRQRTENRFRRTWNNLLLSVLNSVAVRFVPILSAVGAATYAESRNFGVFNWYPTSTLFEYAIVLILFDLIIFWQHVASHHMPILWQFHQVHHADHDLDASSGLRFHPVEIAFSMIIKCIAVLALGATPESIILFEIILNSCAIFNHSNLKIPAPLDSILRMVLVTPDMHRVHHSIHRDETNSNYGFSIPWWDRIFLTYKAQPSEPHEQMRLGVPEFPHTEQTVPIWSILRMPFWKIEKTEQSQAKSLTESPHSSS